MILATSSDMSVDFSNIPFDLVYQFFLHEIYLLKYYVILDNLGPLSEIVSSSLKWGAVLRASQK